jgi:hypothetical protein
MQVTQVINGFLKAKLANHPGRDLVERYLALGGAAAMETQVNVAAGKGEPVEGKRTTWTDGINSWWNIRVPANANATPEWDDYELSYPLAEHAEGIGSTGWDWAARRSRWLGFDFDNITDHAQGVGITAAELEKVCEAAKAIPYIEVRRSTGGRGFHLYVYFDGEGVPTANHTEHAALGRCILGMLSSEANFDFAAAVDCCGGVMWLWHRKMTPENQGLALIKPATKALGVADLPANWRDHIEVVTRRRAKIRLSGVPEGAQDPFEALVAARRMIPLDDKHKAQIQALMETGYSTIWVADHHLLQTHTCGLQELMDSQRGQLGLIGVFKTSSQGKDKGTPNCFLFPLSNGAWKVCRFTPGISEAETWSQDKDGWTTCVYNSRPDFETACKTNGGTKDPDSTAFVFPTSTQAAAAASALGQKIDIDARLAGRETSLKVSRAGKLAVYIKGSKKKSDDPDTINGWVRKKDKWAREYDKYIDDDPSDELCVNDYDNALRVLTDGATNKAQCWIVATQDGEWSDQPASNVKMILQSKGMAKPEAEAVMGTAANRPWKRVCLPFQPEQLSGRQWNINAPQFKYAPLEPTIENPHPHWDMIYEHIGTDLDAAIKDSKQMERLNIRSGEEYLLRWVACMFRHPFEHLPFLFLYGPENCGKSIFHESLALLVTKGVVRADKALAGNNEFNGELAGAVLCVIEERNISTEPKALARIKDWTTAETIPIRRMRTDAYEQPNTTHWVYCAQKQEYCPVVMGDTRIVVIHVPKLLKKGEEAEDAVYEATREEIARAEMFESLREEAPYFLHTLLNITLPPIEGRLRLPVVETANKMRSQEFNQDDLEQFVAECCFDAPGEYVLFKDFYDKFYEWLPIEERAAWNRQKCNKMLPHRFPTWNGTGNKKMIGNLSFLEPKNKDAKPCVVVNGRLVGEET